MNNQDFVELFLMFLRRTTGVDWVLYLILGWRYVMFRFLLKVLG